MNLILFLSIHRAQQPRSVWPSMYFGGSVVGKASTIGIEISPTPPLIFTGCQKCEIWRRLKQYSTFSRPRLKTRQNIRILKQKCNAAMITLV